MRMYLLAGLAVMAASPALAQNQYTQQVNNQLDRMESNARGQGKTRLFRSPIFRLNEGATQIYDVSLVSGRSYTIGGVCDNDCPDLDIKLIDPNGREVAADVLTDSAPVVSHTANMNGNYRVRVVMYDCNVNPCSAGLTVMGSGSGGGGNSAPATGQYDQQVNNQLDTFERGQSGATRLFRSPIFRLNEGASQDYNVTLIAGVPYKIAGVCDNDCPDLDIKLLDGSGNELASDSLTDSLPIVSYRPGQTGNYRVRVVMYDCNVAPCSAGVTVMATGAASSGGSTQYDQQVNNQLDAAERNASGMTRLFRSPIFRLSEGATQDYPIAMRSGQRYTIAGVCDNDCPDMDIKLLDPGGAEIASDTATDSVPVVTHSPSKDGNYTVRVVMYDCNVAPCSAGLTIMGTGASESISKAPATIVARPAPTLGQYDAQVNAQLDTFERGQSSAVRLFRSPIFRLNEGADRDFVVSLIAGVNYKIAGVCDNDCPDLDIKLIDQDGNTLANDALTDSLPIVTYRPTRGGPYKVRVVMYDCNSAPCSAGVTVMATN
jgi:hypothetical protein